MIHPSKIRVRLLTEGVERCQPFWSRETTCRSQVDVVLPTMNMFVPVQERKDNAC